MLHVVGEIRVEEKPIFLKRGYQRRINYFILLTKQNYFKPA